MIYFNSNIEKEEMSLNAFIEKEMQDRRLDALNKISSIVHPNYSQSFALLLAYGFFESHEIANNIADKLDLDKMDFLAIQDEFDAYKDLFKENYEELSF